MANYKRSWRKEEIDTVRQLAAEGKSSRAIADELRDRTRNSVIGLCHREKIALAYGKHNRTAKHTGNIKPPIKTVRKPPPMITYTVRPEVKPEKHLIHAGPYHCRYIAGEARNMIICGEPVASVNDSWCRDHKRIVYAQ